MSEPKQALHQAPANSNFLDSSIVRGLMTASSSYRTEISDKLGDSRRYISPYIQMEVKRSYFANLINFYFVLDMPHHKTVADAYAAWANNFKGSSLKAALQSVSMICNAQAINVNDPRDKKKALIALALKIKRFDILLRHKFTNVGSDSTRCARAAVPFNVDMGSPEIGLQEFHKSFHDTVSCRAKCRIDHFFISRNRTTVETYVKNADSIKNQSPKDKLSPGFIKIADQLETIVQKGSGSGSCAQCEKIGDSVIALDAPKVMILQHTDNSFDYLCPPAKQPHQKQLSEAAFLSSLAPP